MRLMHAVVVVVLGGQGCRDHVETIPMGNAAPATASVPGAAATSDKTLHVTITPVVPPQSEWEAKIRTGQPFLVAMTGRLEVAPFFQPRPGVWEYIVRDKDGAFSLPIIGDTLPAASEMQSNLPGGRQVTTSSVRITTRASGAFAEVAAIPWALPEPGHTVDTDLDVYMAGEIASTGLTLDKAVHGPVGGAPGLLATAGGTVAGIQYQALLWRIYLPASKVVLAYSVYSPTPSDLRTTGEMMLKMFTVGNSP